MENKDDTSVKKEEKQTTTVTKEVTETVEESKPTAAPVEPTVETTPATNEVDAPTTPGETAPAQPLATSMLGRTALDSSIYKLRKSVTTAISRSPKARTYTVVILTIVTVVFFLVFTIVPTVTTIGNLQTELKRKQETLTSLKENVERIETHEVQELQNPEDYAALKLAVPENLEESNFRSNIGAMATKYNLQLTSIRFSPDYRKQVEGLPTEFRRVDTTITLTGDLNGFISFLEHLENYPRIFQSKNVAYIVQDNLTSQTKEFRVRGDIYLVRPQREWANLTTQEK